MLRSAVVDSSPLIFLARTGLLDILRNSSDVVVVPAAVAAEVRARPGRDDKAVAALATAKWLRTGPAVIVPHSVVTWDLDPGESEVIALAAETTGAAAVIDDRMARACAAAHQIPCVGTLGLLLAAKRRREIPAVRPHLDTLVKAGLFVSQSVIDEVIRQAGE